MCTQVTTLITKIQIKLNLIANINQNLGVLHNKRASGKAILALIFIYSYNYGINNAQEAEMYS